MNFGHPAGLKKNLGGSKKALTGGPAGPGWPSLPRAPCKRGEDVRRGAWCPCCLTASHRASLVSLFGVGLARWYLGQPCPLDTQPLRNRDACRHLPPPAPRDRMAGILKLDRKLSEGLRIEPPHSLVTWKANFPLGSEGPRGQRCWHPGPGTGPVWPKGGT